MFLKICIAAVATVQSMRQQEGLCSQVEGDATSLLQLRGTREVSHVCVCDSRVPDPLCDCDDSEPTVGIPTFPTSSPTPLPPAEASPPSHIEVGSYQDKKEGDFQQAGAENQGGITHEIKSQEFSTPFQTEPVVLAGVVTMDGGHPVVPVVEAVKTGSTSMRLDEPDCYDEWHTTETLDWMALPAGVHASDQGTSFVVGQHTASGAAWNKVQFPSGLASKDVVVIVTVMRTAEGSKEWTNLRVRNAGEQGFELLLEPEKNTKYDGSVTVGYFAIPSGEGTILGRKYFAQVTPAEITDAWKEYKHPEIANAAVFATPTHNGGNTANLRMMTVDDQTIKFRMHEPEQCGWDGPHPGKESALLFVLEGTSGVHLEVGHYSDAREGEFQAAGQQNEGGITHEPKTQKFTKVFGKAPVVIAGVVTIDGSHPVVPTIQKITTDAATLRLDEPDCYDEWHTTETLDWLAAPAGVHRTMEGVTFLVGTAEISGGDWSKVKFAQPLEGELVVVPTLQQEPGEWLNLRVQNVVSEGFEVLMESSRPNKNFAGTATVGYIAIPKGEGRIAGRQYSAQVTPAEISEEYQTYKHTSVPNAAVFGAPTHNGGDTANLRMANNDETSIKLRMHEPEECGWDGEHPGLESAMLLFVQGL
eukprot:CAMPEP_0204272786 /NCGR_PEP_ID=MMETSP0468-20130131/22277_1 /ASSEMBLY_ACC=CAM_ASM_000383 /TAXON_ID=2969 /ORGANISM="Oxyrrhis marina" /LENGTH=642 /DNA_ID=CAMNT_0051248669 /DNA_START=66 /DNA_END=1994 /DNA_ORIENTATION=-